MIPGAKRPGDVCLAPTEAERRLAGAHSAEQYVGIMGAKSGTLLHLIHGFGNGITDSFDCFVNVFRCDKHFGQIGF